MPDTCLSLCEAWTSQDGSGRTRAQPTFYQSDDEALAENDKESREDCSLDSKEERTVLEDVDALGWGESVNSTLHRAHFTRATHAIFLCARGSRCLRVVVVLATFHLIHHLA